MRNCRQIRFGDSWLTWSDDDGIHARNLANGAQRLRLAAVPAEVVAVKGHSVAWLDAAGLHLLPALGSSEPRIVARPDCIGKKPPFGAYHSIAFDRNGIVIGCERVRESPSGTVSSMTLEVSRYELAPDMKSASKRFERELRREIDYYFPAMFLAVDGGIATTNDMNRIVSMQLDDPSLPLRTVYEFEKDWIVRTGDQEAGLHLALLRDCRGRGTPPLCAVPPSAYRLMLTSPSKNAIQIGDSEEFDSFVARNGRVVLSGGKRMLYGKISAKLLSATLEAQARAVDVSPRGVVAVCEKDRLLVGGANW